MKRKKPEPMSKFGLIYLATPYSKYPKGIDAAWHDACVLSSRLIRLQAKIYSPIVHTHPIAMAGDIDPYDHSIWLPFDLAIMQRCNTLFVAMMDGWRASYGIAKEIEWFQARSNKNLRYLDVDTLEVHRCVS